MSNHPPESRCFWCAADAELLAALSMEPDSSSVDMEGAFDDCPNLQSEEKDLYRGITTVLQALPEEPLP